MPQEWTGLPDVDADNKDSIDELRFRPLKDYATVLLVVATVAPRFMLNKINIRSYNTCDLCENRSGRTNIRHPGYAEYCLAGARPRQRNTTAIDRVTR